MLELAIVLLMIFLCSAVVIKTLNIDSKFFIEFSNYKSVLILNIKEKWRSMKSQLETIVENTKIHKQFCLPSEYG